MKMYDFAHAPNPRRARVFAAEKGLDIEIVPVNIRELEQFTDWFRRLNPNCTVPVLELDDGTTICDSFAICRYLEERFPELPLMGRDPLEKAQIEMWMRRVELEGYQAVAEILRNSAERFKDRALVGPLPIAQIPELVERGRKRIRHFFQVLDDRLKESAYVAGPEFTAADISALITVDFAAGVNETPPADAAALKAWHAKVSARPSAKA
jgi:glutathione S-transferase